MPTTRNRPQSITPRLRGRNLPRWLAVVRVVALALLFLLPMQMRAGDNDPHPHAMLHLLLDARDGLLDHHDESEHAAEHGGHEGAGGAHEPDVPIVGYLNVAGGAMAMLAALVVMLLVPSARRVSDWPPSAPWIGWMPALEPPPPRAGSV